MKSITEKNKYDSLNYAKKRFADLIGNLRRALRDEFTMYTDLKSIVDDLESTDQKEIYSMYEHLYNFLDKEEKRIRQNLKK